MLVIVDKRWQRVRRWTDTWRPAQCSNKLAVVNVSVAVRVKPVSNGFHLQTTCWKAFTTQHETTTITPKWPSYDLQILNTVCSDWQIHLFQSLTSTSRRHSIPFPVLTVRCCHLVNLMAWSHSNCSSIVKASWKHSYTQTQVALLLQTGRTMLRVHR